MAIGDKIKSGYSSICVLVWTVLFVIGFPGMIDDFAAWWGWIEDMRAVMSWQVAMSLSAVSLVAAVVPWVPWKRILHNWIGVYEIRRAHRHLRLSMDDAERRHEEMRQEDEARLSDMMRRMSDPNGSQ